MSILDNNVIEAISNLQDSLKVSKTTSSLNKLYSSDGCKGDSCSGECDYSCSDDGSCNIR